MEQTESSKDQESFMWKRSYFQWRLSQNLKTSDIPTGAVWETFSVLAKDQGEEVKLPLENDRAPPSCLTYTLVKCRGLTNCHGDVDERFLNKEQ